YLLSCGAHYKLTGDPQARTDTMHAASLLMGRLNPAGFIRAWNQPSQAGFAIIDCLMNLSLLFWASRETGDPRFRNAAVIHADTALREFLRPDGSVSHIIEFDPADGKRVREHAGQGCALGSSWSRGQAWGLYGFTLAFLNTGEERYLKAAQRIAAYFVSHIRPDGLTDSDFCQPPEEERIDNMAGAIAACGLLELARTDGEKRWKESAEKLINGLLDHCADWTQERCGILTHCTASYHDDGAGRHTNITYGDYFLTEALAKLNGADPMLWR
ncbi:MAG: glycoside hydrolase family 88 protein, partial [Clostridia bacterium]|nr:glycoside hydrolase family 88 protein [Clostridia bacterium]